MSHENLSRRAMLRGVAAVPAIAILPAAAAAVQRLPIMTEEGDDPVVALADRAIKAWNEFEAANRACQPFDEAMCKWRKENPPPEPYKFEELCRELDPAVTGLNECEQEREHRAAMAKYKRRVRAADRRTGHAKAWAIEGAACVAATKATDALCDAVPRTFQRLAAKARADRLIDDPNLKHSIVWDIGVIAGDVQPEDRPEAEED